MNAEGRPIDIFSSVVIDANTFDGACSKQVPSNGSNKHKLLHDIIEVKALAHVCKLDLSFLTNARIFWVKENLSNSSCNLRAIATPLMSEISNNPMVTCFAS
jgi:hypothetical protein